MRIHTPPVETMFHLRNVPNHRHNLSQKAPFNVCLLANAFVCLSVSSWARGARERPGTLKGYGGGDHWHRTQKPQMSNKSPGKKLFLTAFFKSMNPWHYQHFGVFFANNHSESFAKKTQSIQQGPVVEEGSFRPANLRNLGLFGNLESLKITLFVKWQRILHIFRHQPMKFSPAQIRVVL